jgi:hypothetical protein
MLQILVATFAQLTTFRSALGNEYTEYASPVGTLQHPKADNIRSDNFTCTRPGRFPNPENCSQYYLCVKIETDELNLSYMTCPNALVFDPESQECTTTDNYACSPTNKTTTPLSLCTRPGFFCNSDTTFTLCADVDVPILTDIPCPAGYFCNENCVGPCINHVLSC